MGSATLCIRLLARAIVCRMNECSQGSSSRRRPATSGVREGASRLSGCGMKSEFLVRRRMGLAFGYAAHLVRKWHTLSFHHASRPRIPSGRDESKLALKNKRKCVVPGCTPCCTHRIPQGASGRTRGDRTYRIHNGCDVWRPLPLWRSLADLPDFPRSFAFCRVAFALRFRIFVARCAQFAHCTLQAMPDGYAIRLTEARSCKMRDLSRSYAISRDLTQSYAISSPTCIHPLFEDSSAKYK